jgi:hypothetical protein
MIKKLFNQLIIFLIFTTTPLIANAWNYVGHVIIAQIAYNNLTPKAKQKADTLANIIYNNLPLYQQNILDKNFYNAATFAKIAELPDVWRNNNLLEIFLNNNALPPLHLLLYSLVPTKDLHYSNLPYPQGSHCQDIGPFNVVWGINKLTDTFQYTKSENAQAVLMVLEEHYIGDIHQPLHTISRYNAMCVNDEGGNDFCLKYNNHKDRCSKNLHQLWDSGVGYIKQHANIQSDAYELQRVYPLSQFKNDLNDNNPMDWAKSNYAYANFIYNLDEGAKPSAEYYRQGQLISKKQMALAGYRLAKVINSELN